MGNRAVITFDKSCNSEQFGIYLHWNGGEESVKAFCDATKELMKSRGADGCYGPARMIQVIGNFFGGTTSLGIGPLRSLDCDNGDNGVFIIDPETFEIIGRKHARAYGKFNKEYYEGVLSECISKNKPFFNKE